MAEDNFRDIEIRVADSLNNYLKSIGVESFHVPPYSGIADIVYDPTEALENEKSRLIGKVKEALSEGDFESALAHMNKGIDKKIISCDNHNSDWFQYVASFVDSTNYFFVEDRALYELFVKDFIRRVEKGEVSTKMPIDQLL